MSINKNCYNNQYNVTMRFTARFMSFRKRDGASLQMKKRKNP